MSAIIHLIHCLAAIDGNRIPYLAERDLADTDLEQTVRDLIAGQLDSPVRVIAVDVAEGTARDVSGEVAVELRRRAQAGDLTLTAGVADFCARHAGDLRDAA
jgi:hypothetical protein